MKRRKARFSICVAGALTGALDVLAKTAGDENSRTADAEECTASWQPASIQRRVTLVFSSARSLPIAF